MNIAEGFGRQTVSRPAFLTSVLKLIPFLSQSAFGKALHFGHFADAALKFGVVRGRFLAFLRRAGLSSF